MLQKPMASTDSKSTYTPRTYSERIAGTISVSEDVMDKYREMAYQPLESYDIPWRISYKLTNGESALLYYNEQLKSMMKVFWRNGYCTEVKIKKESIAGAYIPDVITYMFECARQGKGRLYTLTPKGKRVRIDRIVKIRDYEIYGGTIARTLDANGNKVQVFWDAFKRTYTKSNLKTPTNNPFSSLIYIPKGSAFRKWRYTTMDNLPEGISGPLMEADKKRRTLDEDDKFRLNYLNKFYNNIVY